MTDDQEHPMADDTTTDSRDNHGRYARSVDTVKRDAEALKLRARGLSYQEIADALGYADKSAAHKAVQRGLADTLDEPADDVRRLELERLDRMYDAVVKVLETRHLTVSQGRIIRQEVDIERDEAGRPVLDGEGKPIPVYEALEDDAPVLQAVDRLLKIQARRAALLGLDAPAKVEQGGKLTYEILGVSLEAL